MVDTKQTKTVGEHWACCEPARRGWAPALTRDGIERTDILAVKIHGERLMVEVQVKTTVAAPGRVSWHLGSLAHSVAAGEQEWVVLVAADPDPRGPLRSFVMPRSHASAAAWISHMDWLTHPDAPAGKRTAPVEQARVKIEVFAAYEDRWDMLQRPTVEVPGPAADILPVPGDRAAGGPASGAPLAPGPAELVGSARVPECRRLALEQHRMSSPITAPPTCTDARRSHRATP